MALNRTSDQRQLVESILDLFAATTQLTSTLPTEDHLARPTTERAPDEAAELSCLAAELLRFQDVLWGLRSLVVSIEDSDSKPELASSLGGTRLEVLDRYRSIITYVTIRTGPHTYEKLPSHIACEATAVVLGLKSRISLAVATSKTIGDIVQHLKTCGSLDDHRRAVKRAWDLASSVPGPISDVKVSEPTAADVASWLALFNTPASSPDDYYQEKLFIRALHRRLPQYSSIAARWPGYAEKFWSELEAPVTTLFRAPLSPNFVQWLLEYLRTTQLDVFGEDASSPEAAIDLTTWLFDGSLSPLHTAAALGLPSLCATLLSEHGDSQPARFGTPLSCALWGPRALSVPFDDSYMRPHSYSDPERQGRTIKLLLDASEKCNGKHGHRKSRSLLQDAMWASVHTNDASIFARVLSGGAEFDEAFDEEVQKSFWHMTPEHTMMGRRLLTIAFDHIMSHTRVYGWSDLACPSVVAYFERESSDFNFGSSGPRLHQMTDEQFVEKGLALVYAPVIAITRLSHDPRFGAFIEKNGNGALRYALGDNLPEMTEYLLDLGIPLITESTFGVLPSIVQIESAVMLEILVGKHGADTRVTDETGRNVWHYMAASNDTDCLNWLIQNDPHKEANIISKSHSGNTPTAEAFQFIGDLLAEGRTPVSTRPATAMILLEECKTPECISSSVPLPHLAAAWGQMKLVEGLVELGVNFQALDSQGRSALHHLNLSATSGVVARLQELCRGAPIEDHENLTPVDRYVLNTTERFKRSKDDVPLRVWTQARKALYALFTSESLNHTDQQGRGCWARFAETVFRPGQIRLSSDKLNDPFRGFVFDIIKEFIIRGALRAYEAETKMSAVMAIPEWDNWSNAHIVWILDQGASELAEKWYVSDSAVSLMAFEAEFGTADTMIRYLTVHGVSASTAHRGSSSLELAIQSSRASFPKVKAMLEGLTQSQADLFAARRPQIASAVNKCKSNQGPIYNLLLKKGLLG